MPGGGLEPPTRGFSDLVKLPEVFRLKGFETLDYLPTLNRALDRGGIHRGDRALKGAVLGTIARSLNRALETQEIFKDLRHPDQIQADIDRRRRPAPGDQNRAPAPWHSIDQGD